MVAGVMTKGGAMIAKSVAVSLLTVIACAVASGRVEAGTDQQNVYWTLFASADYPQVQIAQAPMSKKSKAATINSTVRNNLLETSGVAFDTAGRFWILSYGQTNGDPTSALVFNPPITVRSAPLLTLVLSGTLDADALAFDPSGNLWVTSPGNQSVVEYTGPFAQSATLTPARSLTTGVNHPFAVAVDKNGKVYISNNGSTGTNSIAVVKPPYTGQPYFLNGLTAPGGLVFDSDGNLYASSNGSTPAVVRYNSNHLKSGDLPSIVDPAGLAATSYEASFAFTANGDLYAANCGNNNTAGIQVWPLGLRGFSAHLKPSVSYTNRKISSDGCAWGIAIQ
jgi:sugar lactone lactonase YvrE